MKDSLRYRFFLFSVVAAMMTSCQKIDSPVDRALEKSMAAMHSAMDEVAYGGNPDADFARLMIPHHQGAVQMAKVELQFGTDPRLRRLAQEIIVTQESEIDFMSLTLKTYPIPEGTNNKRNWCSP
jgi:uncharacterized protein (DUF305 family)